jgi:riboflavin kinase / FMN adenylyltransferase
MSDPVGARGAVVTVGTFDGVHRGHWHVLATLVEEAERRRLHSVLVTFEPHPLRVVRPEAAPPLLTSHAEKLEILAQFGIGRVVVLRFDDALAAYPPRRFVEEILIGRFGLAHLVIGHDHGFGRDRSGDAGTLAAIGKQIGFGVQVVPPWEYGGAPVSSSRIRRALQEGDVAAAATALGRPYGARGTVVHGEGRGRELGFPTANLLIDSPDKLLPADGIYAVRAHIGDERCDGLLHVGPRPTFGAVSRTVELYLIDFDRSIYGARVAVQFCAWLRGVEDFGTAAALVAAMEGDRAAAVALFASGAGACRPQ